MKAIEYQEKHSSYEVGYALRNSFNAGFIAAKFEEQINQFAELHPDIELTIDGDSIQLSRPTQQEKLDFIKCFGGDWEKEVEDYDKTRLKYIQEVKLGERTVTLKIGYATPPPSCEIIEEDVLVPATEAHYEKKRVLKCKPDVVHAEETVVTDTGVPGTESEAASV